MHIVNESGVVSEGSLDLSQVDLNLLLAFDALGREGSVTRAAQRLGITQPAMSHALGRLRVLLADPVVVRSGRGVRLTPRAEELVGPLRGLLGDLARLLATPSRFEPSASVRSFRITGPDLIELLLLPGLHRTLRKRAPGVSLSVVPMREPLADALETGELDIAILPSLLGSAAPFGPGAEPHLMRKTLLRDRHCAYVSKRHPLAERDSLSMARFLGTSHLLVSPTGVGPGLVDDALEELGKRRHVGLRVPGFATALSVLRDSDMLLIAPTALTSVRGVRRDFITLSLPLKLPEHAVSLVWHPRFSADPAHVWLRQTIAEVMPGRS